MATGHYVRIDNSAENGSEAGLSAQDRDRDSSPRTSSGRFEPFPRLLRGVDDSKDQSYFLSMTRVSQYFCSQCLFFCVSS